MVVGNLLTVYRVNPYILQKSTFSSASRLDCMGCSVHESFFKSSHVFVCKVGGCDSCSHSCFFDLNVVFITIGEIVEFENFLEKT